MKKIVSAFLVAAVISQISLSVQAQLNCINENCANQEDISLFETSPPNVPAMHAISFCNSEISTIPITHFIKGAEQEFAVFCGNSKGLKSLAYKKLENKVKERWYWEQHKNQILSMANGTFTELGADENIFSSLFKWLKKQLGSIVVTSKDEKEVLDLLNLNYQIFACQEYFDVYNYPCVFVADRSLDDIKKLNVSGVTLRKINNEISSIIQSDMPIKSKLEKLNVLVDNEYEKYRDLKKEGSTEDMVNFCVPLYRLNNYLSHVKKNWPQKTLDERKEIYKLGAKINTLMPNYCFLTENDKSPFAGVKVDSYILVTDTEDTKRIYLEKGQIPQFINNLVKSIDSKYTNIGGEYSFDMLTSKDVLRLAEKIHATDYQDLIDAQQEKVNLAEATSKRKLASIGTGLLKGVISVVKDGDVISLIREDEQVVKLEPLAARRVLEKNRPDLIEALPDSPRKEDSETNSKNLIKIIGELNLDKPQLSKLETILYEIVEHDVAKANEEREKIRMERLKAKIKHGLKLEYLNLVKLLIQISRISSMNYIDAIIIEENARYVKSDANKIENKKLIEYNIIELRKAE